jgi:hypothetical protein
MDAPEQSHQKQTRLLRKLLVGIAVFVGLTASALVLLVAVAPDTSHGRNLPRETAKDAQTIRSAVEMYLAESQDCPSIDNLVGSKLLDKGNAVRDRWGHLFTIECTERGPVVRSAGPDGMQGTDDDMEW